MGHVIRLPYSHAGEPSSPHPRRANVGMADAPRDGTPIWVMVAVEGDNGRRNHTAHWLPVQLRWHGGEWRYARFNTKLWPWHREITGWSLDRPECLE
jgi:prepilin-type processing-associated H-X9-DG protein